MFAVPEWAVAEAEEASPLWRAVPPGEEARSRMLAVRLESDESAVGSLVAAARWARARMESSTGTMRERR